MWKRGIAGLLNAMQLTLGGRVSNFWPCLGPGAAPREGESYVTRLARRRRTGWLSKLAGI